MGTISLSLPSDGSTIDAADVNTPFNTIATAINGNLDDTNIASGANISGTKILAASIPGTAADANFAGGWITGVTVPNTIVANGNRSYTLTINTTDLTSKLSPGMRLNFTRTVAAPTQCTSLNGTTQFYSKTSPAGMTFTNNFVVSAWVKLSSYQASGGIVASRYNGTSGWQMSINSLGQISMVGYNGGSGNSSTVLSYQSIPLNKWVHVATQLDMATFTATTTTSYVMIDGVDVPATVTRGGTNPTALIQAGNLEIGSWNGGLLPFGGKIAQVAIYSAKVTQATILASMHQTLAGTETSLISAYSFNNTINDLNANANNLTANGSAVATNADTPFTQTQGLTGITTGTTNYGIITAASFSTNTTLVVQVPEGDTIPTSGGVSAVSYATVGVPYGFPKQRGKWTVETIHKTQYQINASTNTWYNTGNCQIALPIGEWRASYSSDPLVNAGATVQTLYTSLSTSNSSETNTDLTSQSYDSSTSATRGFAVYRNRPLSLSAQTIFYYINKTTGTGTCTIYTGDAAAFPLLEAECAYL